MSSHSLQYQLQRLEVGMVWLDQDHRVTAFNDVAWQLLAPAGEQLFGIPREKLIGIDLVALHPPKSRAKLQMLLAENAPPDLERQPVKSPPPMTMMINIPDRVLLLKVSKMLGQNAAFVGSCMIYYDLTELTTLPAPPPASDAAAASPRRLSKIPVYKAQRLVLVELADTLRLESNDHYTWIVTTNGKYLSNLSLSDLEERLDPATFFRCHRSHIVNLSHVREIARDGESIHIVYDQPEPARVPVSRSHARQLRDIVGM